MQLLSKINEEGTDLSLETWLDSAFILPFKVVGIKIFYNLYIWISLISYMSPVLFLESRASHVSSGHFRKITSKTDFEQRKVY